MVGLLVVWVAVVVTATLLVFGAVVPSFFIRSRPGGHGRRRSHRSPRFWGDLAAFVLVLVIVFTLTLALTGPLSDLLVAYWAWSIPVFLFLGAIFLSWFMHTAGYRTHAAAISLLVALGCLASLLAYLAQPIAWPFGASGIP